MKLNVCNWMVFANQVTAHIMLLCEHTIKSKEYIILKGLSGNLCFEIWKIYDYQLFRQISNLIIIGLYSVVIYYCNLLHTKGICLMNARAKG